MKFFTAMFSEPPRAGEANGNPSSTRAMAALVCVCVVGTWTMVSVRKMELQPLQAEHVALVGVAMGLKAWQRGKENGNGNGNGDGTKFLSKPNP